MRPRYKVTGCARFFLFFIIFIPIVYFGAAYFRGENGMQILKEYYHQFIGRKAEEHPALKTPAAEPQTSVETDKIEELQKKLGEAEKRIKELEDQLKLKEAVIQELKKK